MRAPTLLLAVVVAAAAAACSRNNAQRGGPLEAQLAAATIAADVDSVKRALAAGADPNRMAEVDGQYQAPWKRALRRARADRQPTVEIVKAMLAAHASPAVAWGEEPSRRGGYSVQATTPILEAQFHDVPDAVRALLAAGLDPTLAKTALVLACENRQHDVVHALVEGGVPVNFTNTASTPLLGAIQARDLALVTYLEAHGARERP